MLARDRELPRLTHFRLLSRIGEGASAAVYRAYDERRDRVVALKVLHASTDLARSTLQGEFRVLAGVDHPNLVKLLELGEEDGTHYMTMELVEGVDFVHFVRPQPNAFDEKRLRDALIQCIVGLDQLHALGKVHRDIKPSNVVITEDGRLVILDFGLVTDAHSGPSFLPGSPPPVGTVAYMAPEQVLGGPVSTSADLYALGTMLYQALTGDLPYAGLAHEIRVAKVSAAAPDPRARGLAVPDDLRGMCLRLLSMNPADRPDARQVLTELGAAEWIRDRGRLASLPQADRIPFIGRAQELKRLDDLVSRAKTATVCLHVLAHAGLGKTALLREVSRRVTRGGEVVWLEGCARGSAGRPFEALHGIAEGLSAFLLKNGVRPDWLTDGAESLHELFPGLRRVAQIPHQFGTPSVPDGLERRWRALMALQHLLGCIARERDVVIWIDEFHLADVDSFRVAERLFMGPSSPPVLLVLSSEPGDASLPLAERQTLVLRPLSGEESEALARKLTRDDNEALPLARQLAAASGGHPLLLIELTRLARSQGASPRLPDGLGPTVGTRRAALTDAARDVLDLLVLADVELPAEVLELAVAADGHALARACEQLAREGFLRVDDVSHAVLSLAHPSLALAIGEHIPAQRRCALQRRLCDALAGTDLALAPTLVRMALACDRSEVAAEAAYRISLAATDVLAVERAAHYRSLAAELRQPKAGLVQYEAARGLARTLADAGRSVEAAYSYQSAHKRSSAASTLELHRRSAELFIHSGHMEEAGLQCIRNVLATVGETLPTSQHAARLSLFRNRAWLRLRGLAFEERSVKQVSAHDLTRIDVLWSVGVTLGLVDYVSGAGFQTQGLIHALRAGERSRVARALALEAAFVSNEERPPRSRTRALLARATALGEPGPDPYLRGLLSLTQGMVAWSCADHQVSYERALAAERVFRASATDVLWEVTTAEKLVVTALPCLGRFLELEERVQRYQQEALERGSRLVHASIELSAGYARLLCLDDPREARARIRDAVRLFSRDRFVLQHLAAASALSCIEQYEQRPMGEAHLVAARRGVKKSQLSRTLVCQSVLLQLEARLVVERARRGPAAARSGALELQKIARTVRLLGLTTGAGEATLWVAHARALVSDLDAVPALLQRAEQEFRAAGAVAMADATAYRRGRLLGGEAGDALTREISQRWRAQGVRNPGRLVNAYVPALAGSR